MKTLLIAVLTALLLISSNASANDPNTAHGWPCDQLVQIAMSAYVNRQQGYAKEPTQQYVITELTKNGFSTDHIYGAALMIEFAYAQPLPANTPAMVREITQYCRDTL